ncbi:MAG: hypothetical protein FWE20_02040 [Defluviitaleaceae bacterium]|nr:hypothetical protein [Defluviitaleaceae bacterium]
MLTYSSKYQETEDHIFQHLKTNGDTAKRSDIELECLSDSESLEYGETLKDMKNGNFVKLDDLDI